MANPLQCSCLGNPMDKGAWWATVHGRRVRHDLATKQQQYLDCMEFTAHFGHILKQFNSGKTQSQCCKGGCWPHAIHRLSLRQKNLGPLQAALQGRSTVFHILCQCWLLLCSLTITEDILGKFYFPPLSKMLKFCE